MNAQNTEPPLDHFQAALDQAGLTLKDRYSIPEAAKALGVSPQTARAWVHDGKLAVMEMGPRARWVLAQDLKAFINAAYRAAERGPNPAAKLSA
ncbi:helix-turn-helix domain-containing protein [Magnetofaba australis]|uniref:Helix-turn-helix domain-containing protein n=1 Tax=Magnetofaba australis IT-1 TaxID=1434232 RepID=A0A1Y2K8C5_9PROT|nr:helix-turn-helix domain-containing protein [Magnetofaba australis]OSM06757.1 hypothetical protein MAIT1_00386 [Magnetofaba australis IT-1]